MFPVFKPQCLFVEVLGEGGDKALKLSLAHVPLSNTSHYNGGLSQLVTLAYREMVYSIF